MNLGLILSYAVALATGGGLGWLLGRSRSTASPAATMLSSVTLSDSAPDPTALALFDVDDLDGLNRANDFDTGDRLLDATADILRRALPSGAAMERLESGRFLVWTTGKELECTAAMAEELRELASCAQVHGVDGPVARTLSAGVVVSTAQESRARTILRADLALARAKRAGGDRIYALDAQPTPTLIPTRAAITEAVETGAIGYYVQPVVRLADGAPVGMEHLLRWNKKDGTVSGPSGFIDALNGVPAEGMALFPSLAAQSAQPFIDADDQIFVAFNITATALDGAGSPANLWLESILDLIPADRLVLELVETSMIVAPARTREMLQQLRARGVRIALDDFGTGLSNLERLRTFPVDILKIDRTFIEDLGTNGRGKAIITAMVTLAHSLDLDLICEGVETEEQASLLTDLGVKYAQGYHFGRPAPAADWASRVTARR